MHMQKHTHTYIPRYSYGFSWGLFSWAYCETLELFTASHERKRERREKRKRELEREREEKESKRGREGNDYNVDQHGLFEIV